MTQIGEMNRDMLHKPTQFLKHAVIPGALGNPPIILSKNFVGKAGRVIEIAALAELGLGLATNDSVLAIVGAVSYGFTRFASLVQEQLDVNISNQVHSAKAEKRRKMRQHAAQIATTPNNDYMRM